MHTVAEALLALNGGEARGITISRLPNRAWADLGPQRAVATATAGTPLRGVPCRQRHLFGSVVENDFVEVSHRAEAEMAEVGPQVVPQGTLASQLLPHRPEQSTAELLCLVHQEGQHHQHGEHHRQVLLAMAVVVLEVVPLVPQRVEGLVLDVPPRASTG